MRTVLFCAVTQLDSFFKKNLSFSLFSRKVCVCVCVCVCVYIYIYIYALFHLRFVAGTFWEEGCADMEIIGLDSPSFRSV